VDIHVSHDAVVTDISNKMVKLIFYTMKIKNTHFALNVQCAAKRYLKFFAFFLATTVMWRKNPSWFEQNKQFAVTGSVCRQLSCTHLIAEWSFTHQSCDRSLWLIIPDHLQVLLAHGGSVNNKCFTKNTKKLLTNKSDLLLTKFASLWCHQQCYLVVYFSKCWSFSYRDFWTCKNH